MASSDPVGSVDRADKMTSEENDDLGGHIARVHAVTYSPDGATRLAPSGPQPELHPQPSARG